MSTNPKIRWQENDPKNGVDVNIWQQHIEDISCSTSYTCESACPGVYKPGPSDTIGKCYTYEVVVKICLEVGLLVDADTGLETWEYKGGCYANDAPSLMEKGVAG
jgi:hypothetical protein